MSAQALPVLLWIKSKASLSKAGSNFASFCKTVEVQPYHQSTQLSSYSTYKMMKTNYAFMTRNYARMSEDYVDELQNFINPNPDKFLI